MIYLVKSTKESHLAPTLVKSPKVGDLILKTYGKLELNELDEMNKVIIDVFNSLKDAGLTKPQESNKNILSKKIRECDINTKAKNILIPLEVETVGDLVKLTRRDILKSRNAGNVVLNEIEKFLKYNNLKLKS